jgi:Predicted membrane protein (DUF2306)
MSFSPLLVFHICTGTLAMLSGFAAVSFRKGSRWHRVTGNVFALSMLCLSASGVYLALMKHEPGNVLGGALTFYLVATAWVIARRRDAETDIFDWGALLVPLAVGAVTVTYGLEAAHSPTGLSHGYPIGPYLFLGSVAFLAAAGDVRMIARGGVSGAKRIARHLWRMCFAWFIASASIFLARPHLFPVVLRKTGALYFLSILPLILMIFWLIRVLFRRRRNLYEVAV